jgi:hypothetical protein
MGLAKSDECSCVVINDNYLKPIIGLSDKFADLLCSYF